MVKASFWMAMICMVAIIEMAVMGFNKAKAYDDALANHDAKLGEVSQAIKTGADEMSEVKTNFNKHSMEISDIKSGLSDSKDAIVWVKTQLAETDKIFKESLAEVKGRVEGCEFGFASAQKTIKDVKSAVSQMEDALKDVATNNKSEREKMKGEIVQLNADLYDLENALYNIEKKMQLYQMASFPDDDGRDVESIDELFNKQISRPTMRQ